MNIDTGEILPLEDVKKKSVKEQKRFVEIPEHLLVNLIGMNRKERRRYYYENKKEFKSLGIEQKDLS